MRVLLIGPDLEENLSLRYLASSLRHAGHVTRIATFDCATDAASVLAASGDADLIGLSLCYQVRAPEFLALARELKRLRPERFVIAGGHFASCAARELLEHHAELDVIVVHEGEKALVELAALERLDPGALSAVQGIVYREDGRPVATPPRPIFADLDALPWPDRTGPARLMAGVPTAYMMGSRGCLYACDYCCITTLHRLAPGKRFRQRSTDNIADEMASLFHDRGVRQFIFHDDNFLVPNTEQNLQRIDALDRAMQRRGVRNIGLVLKCRPAEVDRKVFERLREMGLVRVFLGIESGSTQGLASIGRRQSVDDEHRALRICEDLGISTQYTIILFHPEATAQTMLDDLAFVREHAAHPMSFCRAELYAGTPLEQRMIDGSRARGDYLARVYGYSDPATARAWSYAKDLLAERCFYQNNLMGQSIRLDHLAAVFRAFYEGREVAGLVRDFARWQLDVNLDTVALLEELVRACADGRGDESLARVARDLGEREIVSRRSFERKACDLRKALQERSLAMVGLSRPGPACAPAGHALDRLPRHAAAVVLAVGLLRCGSDDSSGSWTDAAVLDGAGEGGWRNQGGAMEAPPPPIGGAAGYRYDGGAGGAGGTGGWINQCGGMEAPPPPIGGAAGTRYDSGAPTDGGPTDGGDSG